MTTESAAKPASRRKRATSPAAAAAATAAAAAAAATVIAKPDRPATAMPDEAKRGGVSLAGLAAFSTDIRTLAVNVMVFAVILLVLPAVLTQFLKDQVLIDPIAVPAAMEAEGITSDIVARRLWDGLKEVKDIAGTAKDTISAIPDSEQIDFSIPDSGLSIDSLIYYVRRFFNIYETHIGGEFDCADAECTREGISLRLRIMRNDLEVIQLPPIGGRTESEYFELAATELMSDLDPFVAIAARSRTEPGRAKALAYQLIAGRHADAKWAHNLVGNLLLDEDKVEAAIREYQGALALDPNFHLARTNLGRALWITGDIAGAREAYESVRRADPRNVFAIEGLADVEISEGRTDNAVALLLEAARANPLQASFLTKAGIIESGRGNTDAAVGHWTEALRVEPNNILALTHMALHYYMTERYADAEELYGAAADFEPGNPERLADHADILILTQAFAEAEARARQAIAIAPGVARYHVLLGWALTNRGREAEALEAFAVAEGLAPTDPDIPYRMAPAYAALERWDEAIAAYRRFMELDPESPMVAVAEAFIAIYEASKRAGDPAAVPEPSVPVETTSS